jgi:DNA-binding response OmpR family regulator
MLVTRVLVVDGNVVDSEMMAEALRAYGHDVSVATASHAAFELVATFSPKVAVLDIGLPKMDGYELARRICASGVACRLIAVTGCGIESERVRARAAGFTKYLMKPVTTAALLAAISGD